MPTKPQWRMDRGWGEAERRVCVRGVREKRIGFRARERERREMVDGRAAALTYKTTMAHLLSNAPLVSKIAMAHQGKVRH